MVHPFIVQEELKARGVFLFTPQDFARIFRLLPPRAKYFLETYTKKGLFERLKKGLYAIKGALPREEVIANALCRPSYISFEYALAKYGILPEMPYVVTSATTKTTCKFTIRGREFSYIKIKKEAFTGYLPSKEDDHTIFIAEPEKALVDYLYFVSLGKVLKNDRMRVGNLNKEKVIHYAQLFRRPGLLKLVADL
ncbi:MAG: hypothetical protein HY001_03845 [Candidatus Portnoybacteria bacterium]|nr:hypothetical protein [Candidatus Portnoybacteria bacterium]